MLKYETQTGTWKFTSMDKGKGFECVRDGKTESEKHCFWRDTCIKKGGTSWRQSNEGNK